MIPNSRNSAFTVETVDAPVVNFLIGVVVEHADEAIVLFALPGHGVQVAARVVNRVGRRARHHAPNAVQRLAVRPALDVLAPSGVETQVIVVVVVPKLIKLLKSTQNLQITYKFRY